MPKPPRPDEPIEPKPWQNGVAPVYIAIFLWIAFFDQVGRQALPIGGLNWSLLGAVVAGPLGYLLLYRPSALWGHRSGMPLEELATSTFGVKGAAVVPGLLLGIGQIILFSVAVGYAVELSLEGLALGGLLDPRSLRASQVGGATMKSPLFLATALFWAFAAALVSLKFTRWIAYLMQFFPIFPAVMLGGAMLAMLSGLPSFRIDPGFPVGNPALGRISESTWVPPEAGLRAFAMTLQWVFAFSAVAGVMGADWGRGSRSAHDVKVGGWVGMAFAPAIVAALTLIALAGYQGSRPSKGVDFSADARPGDGPARGSTIQDLDRPSNAPGPPIAAPPFTFHALMIGGFRPKIGAFMLATFGLASLAPAVSSSWGFGTQLRRLGPGLSRFAWTMMGAATAWLLVIGGWFDRPEVAFNLLGATFSPIAGAIAADYRRHRGVWPGPRNGFHPAGLIAWAIGAGVGLTPMIAGRLGDTRIAQLQPAALAAFVVAYLVYEVLGLVGGDRRKAPEAAG